MPPRTLTGSLTLLCGLILVAMALMITAEVFLRKLLSVSLGGVDELSGYGFAILTSLAFTYAAAGKAHIRIEAFYQLSPTPLRVGLDLLAQLALLAFALFLSDAAVRLALNSFHQGAKAITPMATPLVYPQAIWAAGLCLFAATLAALLIQSIARLCAADLPGFWRLAGPLSEADAARQELPPQPDGAPETPRARKAVR